MRSMLSYINSSIILLAGIVVTIECSIKAQLQLSMKFCNSLVPCKILHRSFKENLILGVDKVGNST